jgi:hypothetical protein
MVVPAERRRWRHIVSIQYATIPVKRRLIFKESEMAWTQRIEKSFPIGGLSKRELVAIISRLASPSGALERLVIGRER